MFRRFLVLLWLALVGVVGLGSTGTATATTTPGAASYTYDGPALAHVEVHGFGVAGFSQTQLSGSREESASLSGEARGTFTTPLARSNATEAVLVPGAGSGTRAINFKPNAADPNWGLTSQHLNKHLFGSGKNSLSQIDAAGNPDLWRSYIQELAGRPATSTLKGGIEDIIGTFPKADGSGTFQFGIRISPSSDGAFDLVTLLTKQ